MKAFTFYPKRNVSLCANREFFKREINKQPLFSARVERKDPDERGGRTSSLSQVPSHIHMFALAYDEIIGLISLTAVGACKNIMFGLYLRSSSQNCPSSHIVK